MSISGSDVLPPGPPSLPLVGSLLSFARAPLSFLRAAHAAHGDAIYLGKALGKHLFVFAHPDAVRHVLQENHRNYVKGDNFKAIRLVVGDGLVVSEGDHWKKQRRLVQPVFHRARVAALAEQMGDVVARSHASWDRLEPGAELRVAREMMGITQRILMRTLFDFDSEDQTASLCQAWDVVLEHLTARLFAPPIQLPLAIPIPAHRRFARAMKVLDDTIYGVLRQARERGPGGSGLLPLLLAARDDETGLGMTDLEIRDEIMTMFAGGFETSAMVLTWCFHLLAAHPRIYARVEGEVDAAFESSGATWLDRLAQLRHSKSVLEETMRLYPGAWVFTRSNLGPDTVGDYRIPPGSILFLSPYLTHRHPAFWDHPEHFDPERFSPERSKARPRFAYFPFGGGPRLCVGEAFSTTEMLIVLASTIRRYRLRPVPGCTVEPEGSFTLRPKGDVLMTLEPRRHPLDGPRGRQNGAS